MTRIAISPRFATSTLVNIGREGYPTAGRPQAAGRAQRLPSHTPGNDPTISSAVQSALDLVGPRPAPVTPPCRRGAVGAADRRVPAVVQLVVGHVVARDVVPHV